MILIALGANLPSHAGSPAQTLRASLAVLSENAVHDGFGFTLLCVAGLAGCRPIRHL